MTLVFINLYLEQIVKDRVNDIYYKKVCANLVVLL